MRARSVCRWCSRGAAPLLALGLIGLPASPQVLAPPTPPTTPRLAEAVIRFEGGTLADNVPRVLQAVAKAGQLKTVPRTLRQGDNVCSLYQAALGIPGGCTDATMALAQQLNPAIRSIRGVRVGQTLAVPEPGLRPYEYRVKLDRHVGSEARQASQFARKANSKDPLLVRLEGRPEDGSMVLVYRGFELRVPLSHDRQLDELMKSLLPYRSANVMITANSAKPAEKSLYAFDRPGEYWRACVRGATPQGDEGHLGLLLGDAPATCTAACRDDDCPELILVDTEVLPHPDLRKALRPFPGTPSPSPSSSCRDQDASDADHGTHLAGIMAAAPDGVGFVGLNPQATVVPLPLSRGEDAIFTFMGERDHARRGFPIYVFASSWEKSPHAPLLTDDARVLNYAVARAIQRLRPLVIAAAGNEGDEVTSRWPRGPMNLGDLNHVVVVAACDECRDRPTIWPQSNRSAPWSPRRAQKVHLAAPGKGIPSTVGGSQYALASGTSQATAFVAGVASAMVGCYPLAYREPHWVKTRLQVTSRPFPASGDPLRADAALATGVLDPEMALLDPAKEWVKRSGKTMQAAPVKRWTQGEIVVLDPVTGRNVDQSPVRTRDILRVVQVPGPDDQSPKQWVIYKVVPFDQDNEHQGEVVRVGPGRIATLQTPILEICGEANPLSLSQLEDVLLSAPIESQPHRCRP